MAKLFVICGHGAGDPGACGNGYQEAERVRTLATKIKELGGDHVVLGDVNRNWFKDNGISYLNISKDCQILELHMDSSDNITARGAHVIIDAKASVDEYDTALAEFLSRLLPGRSETIVKRNNLANPARAYASGYSYRLVECGFISNDLDVSVFNGNVDNIAKGILDCFDITDQGSVNAPEATPQPTPETPTSLTWGIGTKVCVKQLSRSADGTAGVVPTHYEGTITKLYPGQPYPYLLDNGAGFVNDAIIAEDPHIPGAVSKPQAPTSSTKYGIGQGVCTCILATSSTGGNVYKGDWRGTITRVVPNTPYPYLLDNGTGWTNDDGIDSDPHVS